MSGIDAAIGLMEEGLKGRNIGVPFRKCPKLTQHIYGTRKGTYYLYGAETGLGKTKFVRDQHIYAVHDYFKEINDPSKFDYRIVDFSLEINKGENTVNAIIRKIYIDHGIKINYDQFMNFSGKNPLPPHHQKLVRDTIPYFKELEQRMLVVEGEVTPTKYHDVLLQLFRKYGTFANDDGQTMAVSRLGEYTPKNKQLMVVAVFDTINLTDNEKGQNDKQSIDRISRIAVNFRNICGMTPIIIQQFNADNSEIQRQKHGIKTPQLRDFEDSKRTTKDANVVVGLWSPARYKQETMELGNNLVYDIVQLQNWFVSAHILKHRNGITNRVVPLRFLGATSMFEELPAPMHPMDYARLTKY